MAGPRTIIVTGASRGIGHATALRFLGMVGLIGCLGSPQATCITVAEIPIDGEQRA